MHCILINSNNLKQVKFIQKYNAIYHFVESDDDGVRFAANAAAVEWVKRNYELECERHEEESPLLLHV